MEINSQLFSNFQRPSKILGDKFVEQKQIDEITKSINLCQTPEQLKFFYGGEDEDFIKIKLLNLKAENKRFTNFFKEWLLWNNNEKNKLRIHVDIGNIYYDNFNTDKSIYDFLLAQQNSDKKLINIEFF